MLAWLVFLTPKGEDTRLQIPHFQPDYEERLLYHIDSINATMLKLSRN
jgi:hypothetical protein